MRLRLCVVILATIGLGLPQHASSAEPCRNSEALGVSRTVIVDTANGGLFGKVQYKDAPTFLADKEVVLTFDDGPYAETTPDVLEALAQQCTKATFFYVGRWALRYPGVLAQVDQAGHTIAAHTWAHANLRKLPGDHGQAEIEKGISMLTARLGHPIAPFFRFPYLSDPAASKAYLKGRNIAIFSADVDSWDSHGLTPSSRIVDYVMSRLKKEGHGIVLMHDIKHTTAAALPEILRQLKSGGFKIVHMVAKTPATTLAPFDAWAAKTIQEHDSGVAMAKTEEPVIPEAGDSLPDVAPAETVVAAAGLREPNRPIAAVAKPESATVASVVRLAVAASSAAVTIHNAPKPAQAKPPGPAVVAVNEQKPVAPTPDAKPAAAAKVDRKPLVVVATRPDMPKPSGGKMMPAAAVAQQPSAPAVVAANLPKPITPDPETKPPAAGLVSAGPVPKRIDAKKPPPVNTAKSPAGPDKVRIASLDNQAPVTVPVPARQPETQAAAPATQPKPAVQGPLILRAPRKAVTAAVTPAQAAAPARVAALPPILRVRPVPEAAPAPPPPRKVALLQPPKAAPPVDRQVRLRIARPAPQPEQPVDKPPAVTPRRVIQVVARNVPKPLRPLKLAPLWVARNDTQTSTFTALPLSKR